MYNNDTAEQVTEAAGEQSSQKRVNRSGGRGRGRSSHPPSSTDVEKVAKSETPQNENGESGQDKKERKPREPRKFESVAELEKKISELKQNTPSQGLNEATATKRIEELNKKIEEAQEQLAKKRQRIEEFDKSNKKYEQKKQELYDALNQFNEVIRAKHREKDNINSSVVQLDQECEELKKKRDELQKDLQYVDEEKFDSRIKELENKLTTETHPPKTEKALVGQIGKLRKSREHIKVYTALKQDIANIENDARKYREQTKEKQKEIDKLKNERDEKYEELKKLKEQTKSTERNQLDADCKKLRAQIKDYFKEIDEVKKSLRESKKNNASFERQLSDLQSRLVEQRLYEQRKKDRELKKQEYEARRKKQEEEAKRWEEYNELVKQNPYEVEIGMCDALIVYLEKLQKSYAAKLQKQQKQSIGAYAQIIKPQKQKAEPKKQQLTINHPIDKFQAFSTLNVEIPTNVAKIDQALQDLKKKRKDYKLATPAESHAPEDFEEMKEITKVNTTATLPEEEEEQTTEVPTSPQE
jgi:uncharacterized coiled-coil DUF342 family protein